MNIERKGIEMKKSLLVEHLLKHSVKIGEFTLKSGQKSGWFCDSKQTACRGEGIKLIADLILDVIPAKTTAIGGLAAGADPVAFGVAGISAERGRPLKTFSIRKEAKDHGVLGRFSGALDSSDKAVIVEDTATRGVSAMEAVDVVEELGAGVLAVIAVVDRGGRLAELAQKRGLEFFALTTAVDMGFDYDSGD